MTGRLSIRRSVKTDRNERFSAQRKRSVFSECRPLQRSGGGRAARAALLRHHWGCEVRCEVSPLSGPCACLHHWIAETCRGTNRQTHRCSEQAGLSASWCGTGAVTGGD